MFLSLGMSLIPYLLEKREESMILFDLSFSVCTTQRLVMRKEREAFL